MANARNWPGQFDRGVKTVDIPHWEEFYRFVTQMLDLRQYVWRGQASSSWLLESTLDRSLKNVHTSNRDGLRQEHLKRFRYASRGRRGINPPTNLSENEWWALGQHFGLATPLLDWTSSPFVAAYFAFLEEKQGVNELRAIYALSRSGVTRDARKRHVEAVEFVEPFSDDNFRLVNQGGLFTRTPAGVDLESWIKEHYTSMNESVRLFKILIPDDQRLICLRSLNRMNINSLSLFPDLSGASAFANLHLTIKKY